MSESITKIEMDDILPLNNGVRSNGLNPISTAEESKLRFHELLLSEFPFDLSDSSQHIDFPCENDSYLNTKQLLESTFKSDDKDVEQLLLELVLNGKVDKVENIFSYCKQHFQNFNHWEILFDDNFAKIPIKRHNIKMFHVILEYQNHIGTSLFFAIQEEFVEGVRAIVNCPRNIQQTTSSFNDFGVEASPLVFAACTNSYKILSILYEKYEMPEHFTKKIGNNVQTCYPWEVSISKQVYYKALCSPAYITLHCEKENKNPFDHCIEMIKIIRQDTIHDKGKRSFYESLLEQVEDYMCCLLDQIHSTSDLRHVFDWFSNDDDNDGDCQKLNRKLLRYNPKRYEQLQKRQFDIMENAIHENLKKFVTHENAQIIFSKIRYHNIPRLLKRSLAVVRLMNKCLGFLYFLWPLLTCFPPWTKIGELVEQPAVLFECHLIAEFMFVLLLFLNTITKTPMTDFLGSPPTIIEWLIVIFVISKCVGEAVEMKNRGTEYLKDWWNYFDLTLLLLFLLSIILRLVDYVIYSNSQSQINKHSWNNTEPRLLSSGFLSLAYVLACIRCLSFSRDSKLLGPLRVSLAKMLINVVQFLVLFLLLLFAFALGLSELYWYYGTPQGVDTLCASTNKTGADYGNVLFSNFGGSLTDLFWTLFGYLDLNQILSNGRNKFNDYLAIFLLGAYHISVIVVLLNMLIAMMSQSFDETNEDQDAEWKFHRTSMWIRFIRNDISKPPPMNLLPNFYSVYLYIKRFYKRTIFGAEYYTIRRYLTDETNKNEETLKEAKQSVLKLLLERYKKKHIFKDSEKDNFFLKCCQKYSLKPNEDKLKFCKEDNLEMLVNLL